MSNRTYVALLGALVFLAALLETNRIPFSPQFRLVAVSYLVVLAALPWCVARLRIVQSVIGVLATSGGAMFLLLWCLSDGASAANASTALIFAAAAHFLLLRTMLPDRRARSVLLFQDASIVYIVLMWIVLNHAGIVPDFGSSSRHLYDARFLFWPPFLATALWAYDALIKRSLAVQLMLVVAVMQPAVGFVDLQLVWHLSWAYAGVCCSAACALGLGIWVLRSQPKPRVDPVHKSGI